MTLPTLPNNSLLILTPLSGAEGPQLSPYSSRSLTQTLQQVSSSGRGSGALGTWLREDVNGTLHDLTPHQFRKYDSVISCGDMDTPALDGAWYGLTVEVQCAAELSYLTATGAPQRPVVSGSSRTSDDTIWTFYRPILIMKIYDVRSSFAEWQANYRWQMSLREVAAPA